MKDRLQCLTVDGLPCQRVCILSREPHFAAKFDEELDSLFQNRPAALRQKPKWVFRREQKKTQKAYLAECFFLFVLAAAAEVERKA